MASLNGSILCVMGIVAVSTLIILFKLEGVMGVGSASSDYGKFQLHASGADAYVYFTDDLDMWNKVHVVLAVAMCNCVGSADVQKINQLDYFAMKHYIYSFAVYVHYDSSLKTPANICTLNAAEIQARTELEFNAMGLVILSDAGGSLSRRRQESNGNVTLDLSSFLPTLIPLTEVPTDDYVTMHAPAIIRIEGLALLNAIVDYMTHSYVQSNERKIIKRGGGILMIEGNVELRPCNLNREHMLPWLLNDYEQRHTIKYTDKSTAVRYFTRDETTVFNQIVNSMVKDGLITPENLMMLKVNNGESYNLATFPFQAVYIPYEYAWDVATYLERFAYSGLSPYLYVPFIFQMLWAEDTEWTYYTRKDNFTMRVGEPLLRSCAGHTIQETVAHVNTAAAQGLYFFAASGCSTGMDVEYIVGKAKLMAVFLFYEVMFYIMLSFFILWMTYLCWARIVRVICCMAQPFKYRRLTNLPDTELDSEIHKI